MMVSFKRAKISLIPIYYKRTHSKTQQRCNLNVITIFATLLRKYKLI